MCFGIQELMDSQFLLVMKVFFIYFFIIIIINVPGNWQLQWITHVMRIGLEIKCDL